MNKIDYLRSIITPLHTAAAEVAGENLKRGDVQPAVEPEIGGFLSLLVRLTSSKRVLELGTSNGCSALYMLPAISENGGRLISIDSKERLHKEAQANISAAGFADIAELIFGDAEDAVSSLEPGFDMIFQDCGKYLYPKLHNSLVEILKPGGFIVADDTLFSFEPDVRVNLGRHTDRYNRMVFDDPRLDSSILPIGHGLTISVKK